MKSLAAHKLFDFTLNYVLFSGIMFGFENELPRRFGSFIEGYRVV